MRGEVLGADVPITFGVRKRHWCDLSLAHGNSHYSSFFRPALTSTDLGGAFITADQLNVLIKERHVLAVVHRSQAPHRG